MNLTSRMSRIECHNPLALAVELPMVLAVLSFVVRTGQRGAPSVLHAVWGWSAHDCQRSASQTTTPHSASMATSTAVHTSAVTSAYGGRRLRTHRPTSSTVP